MSTLSLVLLVLAAGLVLLQAVMFAAWVTAVSRGASGTLPFWPLLLAVALAIAGVLTR